jgi:hypothetical protein
MRTFNLLPRKMLLEGSEIFYSFLITLKLVGLATKYSGKYSITRIVFFLLTQSPAIPDNCIILISRND